MTEYRKVYAYHEKNDRMYELKSYWTSSETTQFESGENLEEYRSTTENNINLKADRIEYDLDAGMLYLYSDETKIDEIPFRVSIKPKVNLGDIDNLQITQDNSAIKLSWDDPIDIEFSGLKIVEWAGTKVVRKEGSCPDSIEDGTLVIDSKTRNAYSSTPYSDSGLVNGTEYYYRFFPYDTEGNIIGDTCGEIIRVITLVPIEIPTVTETYTYTGDTITPTFTNYDSDKMTRSGANSAKNAGTYTVTFTPKEGYMWVDTTVEAKEVTWTINPATISVVPSQSGTLTYNEQSQSPTWSNYNSDQLTISGDTNGTNAGDYTAVFTPKANYVWEDGSVYKSVDWSINILYINITFSENPITIFEGEIKNITMSGCNDGYYLNSSPQFCSASITNDVLSITGIAAGNETITIINENSNNIHYSGIIEIQVKIVVAPIDLPYNSPKYATVCNEKLYVLGSSISENKFSFYELNNDEWFKLTNLPSNMNNDIGSVVTFDNTIYVCGTNYKSSNYSGRCYSWDGNTWVNITSPEVNGVQLVVYNNELHALGYYSYGTGSKYKSGTFHKKLQNNNWVNVSTMPYKYNVGKIIVYNNEIHMLSLNTSNYTAHYKWDGINWSQLPNLPHECTVRQPAVVYNNKLHILGTGLSNWDTQYGKTHYEYDGNDWKTASELPYWAIDSIAVVYENKIHLMGGSQGCNPNSVSDAHYTWDGNIWIGNK